MEAFPFDERREVAQLEKLYGLSGYDFNAIEYESDFIGILETWEFESFRFLEHIAIIPALQSRGLGKRVLLDYLGQSSKPIYLEAEHMVTPEAEKRIRFYLNSGFQIVSVDYTQPPYYAGKSSVPMILFTSAPVEIHDVELAIANIRENVYFQNDLGK